MVGILLSYWGGLFSEAMLVSGFFSGRQLNYLICRNVRSQGGTGELGQGVAMQAFGLGLHGKKHRLLNSWQSKGTPQCHVYPQEIRSC